MSDSFYADFVFVYNQGLLGTLLIITFLFSYDQIDIYDAI